MSLQYRVGIKRSRRPENPGSILCFSDSIGQGMFGAFPVFGIEDGTITNPSFAEKLRNTYSVPMPTIWNAGIPAVTSGDIDGDTQADEKILHLGEAVILQLGINDCSLDVGTSVFQSHMTSLINKIKAVNKIPIIPTITYSENSSFNGRLPSYNAIITDTLWNISGVVQGPDLYTAMFDHRLSWLQADGTHPGLIGVQGLLDEWVESLSWLYT